MNDKNKIKENQRVRKNRLFFRVDDDELRFIQAKMKALSITNREAYLRKMSIDGKCIKYEYSDFEQEMRRCNYLVDTVAKNINQVAKRINSTGNIYDEDILELKSQVEELAKTQREIMKMFVKEVTGD